jgi:L-threonylcarbamoyladenylate synthase
METEVLTVTPEAPDPAPIGRAAETLRGGGLVAFPTETVYGLGANALDAAAVARIFEAKGRPSTNPVIAHVPDAEAARSLVSDWPEVAERLAARFWPGPLTLVLPKSPRVPDIVTAGGPTVAVRVPAHPVARALLEFCGLPIAAPSANRSTQVSPTRAAHVLRGLEGRIDLLLDGGPAAGGIESTVLDVTVTPPRLLRPGIVTARAIEAVTGPLAHGAEIHSGVARSPGQMERHYSPRAGLENAEDNGRARVESLARVGLRVGWLAQMRSAECGMRNDMAATHSAYRISHSALIVPMPSEPAGYASRLYAALHELDEAGVDRIIVSAIPETDDWAAVRDRLRRAAAAAAAAAAE